VFQISSKAYAQSHDLLSSDGRGNRIQISKFIPKSFGSDFLFDSYIDFDQN
jgi:hypothetical protein